MSSFPYILIAGLIANAAFAEFRPGVKPVASVSASSTGGESYTGDHITLKSGRILQGVRIIRKTPLQLFLEVIPAIDPLIIPAKQVRAITYGETRPANATPPTENVEEEVSNVLTAVKVSPELVRQLAVPFAGDTIEAKDQDIINTLRSAGIKSGISVTFGARLEELPPEQRRATIRIETGESFEDFIHGPLARAKPEIAVEYRFDTVHFDLVAE